MAAAPTERRIPIATASGAKPAANVSNFDLTRPNFKAVDPKDTYSRLIKYKSRKLRLIVSCGIVFFIFASIIFANMRAEGSWLVLLSPILLTSIAMLFVQETEEWEYKPWQVLPERYERTMFD